MRHLRTIPVVALLAVALSGCYGTLYPVAAAGVYDDDEYADTTPYYGNYAVYYDSVGLPYYYYNGIVRYIPRTDIRFNYYRNYYHGGHYRYPAGHYRGGGYYHRYPGGHYHRGGGYYNRGGGHYHRGGGGHYRGGGGAYRGGGGHYHGGGSYHGGGHSGGGHRGGGGHR